MKLLGLLVASLYCLSCAAQAPSHVAPVKLQVSPTIDPSLFDGDASIVVRPISPAVGQTAELWTYNSCTDLPASIALPYQGSAIAAKLRYRQKDISPIVIQLSSKLSQHDTVCIVEKFYGDDKTNPIAYAVSASVTVQAPHQSASTPPYVYHASIKSARTYERITVGADVSASASADPAANFVADLSFDIPFSNADGSLYHNWSSFGYLRLASIAQPGAINGVSDPATYIQPLTDSTPNNLVQSWETNIAVAHRISPSRHLGDANSYWSTSLFADAGLTSPLSVNQAKPTVYVANQDIYSYYTTTSPLPDTGASAAIRNACVVPASGTFPTCYIAYTPQDRTRFFRSYGVGLVFKRYRYEGSDGSPSDKFEFPGSATIEFGQNEYVTKGQLHGLVLHGDAFWPIPGFITSGKLQGTLYLFGSIDTHLSRNQSQQQFILPTAASTITLTSPNVAIIPVQQPDRDRYRFGVSVDLLTLAKAVGSASGK